MIKRALLVMIIVSAICAAQEGTVESGSPFGPFAELTGTWHGEEEGVPGKGTGYRVYEFIMNDTFLFFKNRSVFDPQEKNPEGEVHEDWGIFSYDKLRKTIVLRQFHIEGFVNQFRVESSSEDGTKIVMISESIENLPPGFKARMTYHFSDSNSFTEKFELAGPGKEFATLVENKWTRASSESDEK